MSSSFQQQQDGSTRVPRPCAAGCSFFGSPETLGMCSACYNYKMHCANANGEPAANNSAAAGPAGATAASSTAAKPAAAPAVATADSSASAKPAAGVPCAPATTTKAKAGVIAGASVLLPPRAPEVAAPAAKKKAEPARCAACYKKVGLLGFVCRCKKTFCGTHLHAEEHGCSFDFKGAGRNAIARNNPLVKGDKLAGRI